MNAPAPYPHGSLAPGEQSRTRRQAVARGTGFVLFATLLAVTVGAWPMIEVAARGERALSARRGLERALRSRGWAVGHPKPAENRIFGPSHVEDRHDATAELLGQLLQNAPGGGLRGHLVRPRGELELLAKADPAAASVATVDANSPLLVMDDRGAWLRVAATHERPLRQGWVPREAILTLP